MNENLKQVLERLYYFLRDNAFSYQAEELRKLIYYIEIGDAKLFKKEFKSVLNSGGAGSIRDIEFRNTEKQNELDNYLNEIKQLGQTFR